MNVMGSVVPSNVIPQILSFSANATAHISALLGKMSCLALRVSVFPY